MGGRLCRFILRLQFWGLRYPLWPLGEDKCRVRRNFLLSTSNRPPTGISAEPPLRERISYAFKTKWNDSRGSAGGGFYHRDFGCFNDACGPIRSRVRSADAVQE